MRRRDGLTSQHRIADLAPSEVDSVRTRTGPDIHRLLSRHHPAHRRCLRHPPADRLHGRRGLLPAGRLPRPRLAERLLPHRHAGHICRRALRHRLPAGHLRPHATSEIESGTGNTSLYRSKKLSSVHTTCAVILAAGIWVFLGDALKPPARFRPRCAGQTRQPQVPGVAPQYVPRDVRRVRSPPPARRRRGRARRAGSCCGGS